METLTLCYTWLFQSAKSIYLFLYQGSGWIGISIIGLAVLKRIVNLIRGAHGK
ncbi:MAG: hypothetical protein KH611_00455 [Clostridium sp.]|nr:hypothetical protein [Clostridium sp.]